MKKISDFVLHKRVYPVNKGNVFNRITYIGGTGKIGDKALPLLINGLDNIRPTEIQLMCSKHHGSKERLTGKSLDLLEYAKSLEKRNISINVYEDYSQVQSSDVTICSAGLWPSQEEWNRYLKIDPSGRNVLTIANLEMVKNIVREVSKISNNQLFLMATNQVDALCEISRQLVPDTFTILGLSGYVDSSRFRQIAYEEARKTVSCQMIGYHNPSMIPLQSSFRGDELNDKTLKLILTKTRKRGGKIANLERAGAKKVDAGASVLPAAGLANAVLAYLGCTKPLIHAWNTKLCNEEIANFYGLKAGESLSVPIEIKQSTLSYFTKYRPNEAEISHIKKIRKDLLSTVKQVNDIKL